MVLGLAAGFIVMQSVALGAWVLLPLAAVAGWGGWRLGRTLWAKQATGYTEKYHKLLDRVGHEVLEVAEDG